MSNKEFFVRNGLIVGNNVLTVNVMTNTVLVNGSNIGSGGGGGGSGTGVDANGNLLVPNTLTANTVLAGNISTTGDMTFVTAEDITVSNIYVTGVTSYLNANSIYVSGNVVCNTYFIGNGSKLTHVSGGADGSSSAKAAASAAALVSNGITTNGVYWIDLPNVGPKQCYCILDPNCAGGGWIMAIKGANTGSTFQFSASDWTANTTVNETDTTIDWTDAKFDAFNQFPATDWLAIFPDTGIAGGDISGGYMSGWTWVQTSIMSSQTLLDFLSTQSNYTIYSNGTGGYTATSPTPDSCAAFGSSVWSAEYGFEWYGVNGTNGDNVIWGFSWNNEGGPGSNDAGGGIGNDGSTCRDWYSCCGSTGLNRGMAFMWFVR